jgi:hypothetical protein
MQDVPTFMGVAATLVDTCGCFYVLPHDDPGVGPSDEVAAVSEGCDPIRLHVLLQCSESLKRFGYP